MTKVPDNIIIKKIEPTFTTVLTTAEVYKSDVLASGLIDASKATNTLKDIQYVVAVGPSVRNCKPGDLVKFSPNKYSKYAQRKVPNVAEEVEGYSKQLVGYDFNIVEMDGIPHLLLVDNDVEYVITEFEDISAPVVYTENKNIIV